MCLFDKYLYGITDHRRDRRPMVDEARGEWVRKLKI